jgi:hypothetical protein
LFSSSSNPGGVGPYERTVQSILEDIQSSMPDLYRQPLAIGAPPWFVERLGSEIGTTITKKAAGMEILELDASNVVVGLNALGQGPLGEFVVQDLLHGGGYQYSLYCHPDVEPARWESMTLAVRVGLNPAAAAAIATLEDPHHL